MRIEIICTGDEVLTGKIVNTNFSYMAQKLEDFGLSVAWGTIVGDDREELLAAFRLSAERRWVIVDGGLVARRIAQLPGAEKVVRRCFVARQPRSPPLSASTACAATCKGSPLPSAPISSGCDQSYPRT